MHTAIIPRISVVMIFFNSERYIAEALESVLGSYKTSSCFWSTTAPLTQAPKSLGPAPIGIRLRCAICSTMVTSTGA